MRLILLICRLLVILPVSVNWWWSWCTHMLLKLWKISGLIPKWWCRSLVVWLLHLVGSRWLVLIVLGLLAGLILIVLGLLAGLIIVI